MTNLAAPASRGRADDLLHGFDTCDDDTIEFLSSLITAGLVPQTELDELQDLSLTRGVEEWDMLFSCASALRERSGVSRLAEDAHVEKNLVPFLETVVTGRPAGRNPSSPATGDDYGKAERAKTRRRANAPRGRGLRKGVSPFWGEEDDTSKRIRPGKRDEEALLPVDDQDTVPESLLNDEEIPAAVQGTRDPVIEQARNAGLLAPSNTTVRSQSESPKDNGRPVKATGGSKSPFFGTPARIDIKTKPEPTPPSTKKKIRAPRGTVSSLPIPLLSADRFGLIQEELAGDPFRLLIAITFLIRTTGKAAIPVFRKLMERFPSPEALVAADPAEITTLIHPLGLSVVRCAAIQKYARMWLERPPTRDLRYGVKNYPQPGDGRHVRVGEEFGPEDRSDVSGAQAVAVDAVADARDRGIGCAWEIGHLTQGPYALDSWRIFCRDILLGRSTHWTGRGNAPEFQPEWMRVLPRDKELRACLRWMWMREGWEWDPLTGEREPLREDMRRAVDDGRVGYDDSGNLVILGQAAGSAG